MRRLNIGVGNHYAHGWINVDRVYTDTIRPDIVNPTGRPLLLDIEPVDRIYLGHVVEHVPWDSVASFLSECLALLNTGGQIMVVGPDTWRTLTMWKAGQASDDLVRAVLEGPHPQVDGLDVGHDGARHCWNADQDRIVRKLVEAGFDRVHRFPSMRDVPHEWPVVARPEWQSAVSAVAP